MSGVRVNLSDRDLSLLRLALRGYVEGVDGDYDDDHVAMDALADRLAHTQRKLRQREQA